MAEHGRVGIFNRFDDALCHRFFFLLERAVDRDDDKIEFFKEVVGKVERAIGKDVAFDAGEDVDLRCFEGADFFDLFF